MKIINYIFYRVSYVYTKKYKDKQGYIYGSGLVTIMEIMHISIVLLFAAIISSSFNNLFFESSKNTNYLHSWTTIPILIIFLLNAFFFNKKKYIELESYWANEDDKLRKKRGWLIFLYLFLILFITITLAIYRSHL